MRRKKKNLKSNARRCDRKDRAAIFQRMDFKAARPSPFSPWRARDPNIFPEAVEKSTARYLDPGKKEKYYPFVIPSTFESNVTFVKKKEISLRSTSPRSKDARAASTYPNVSECFTLRESIEIGDFCRKRRMCWNLNESKKKNCWVERWRGMKTNSTHFRQRYVEHNLT